MDRIRKALISFLTIVVTAGPWVLRAMNYLPGGTASATVLSVVLGVAGSVLHYLVPNTTTDPAVAAAQSVKLVDGVQPVAGVPHTLP